MTPLNLYDTKMDRLVMVVNDNVICGTIIIKKKAIVFLFPVVNHLVAIFACSNNSGREGYEQIKKLVKPESSLLQKRQKLIRHKDGTGVVVIN